MNKNPKATKLYNIFTLFASPILNFFFAGNICDYKPFQGTNREKYFDLIISRRRNSDFGTK